MIDIRDKLFHHLDTKRFFATLTAERAGVLSGAEDAYRLAESIGVELKLNKTEGAPVSHLEVIGHLSGAAKHIAQAEESLIGTLAKASGIATAANTAMLLADGRVSIVCGGWKKMPPELKHVVRRAIASGGASFRITEPPMLYLDKNFIRMLGSIPQALEACAPFEGHARVVQIKGLACPIEEEAEQAVRGGCDILMVDTGDLETLDRCAAKVRQLGARGSLKLAFAGGIKLTHIPDICTHDIDILCVGKEIVDAPLLDIRLDVVGAESWD